MTQPISRARGEATGASERVGQGTWNPLAIRGTPMQPSLLLMSKIVVLCFILTDDGIARLPSHLIPFVGFLRHVGSPLQFHRGLQAGFVLAALCLFFNRWVRTASVVAGAVILVGIASSIPYYENNLVYTGLILVLAGLHGPEGEPWLLRLQVVLLYFAAALNKVLLSDWRDGYFMSAWLGYSGSAVHATWTTVSGHFPPRVLATVVSWGAIVTEFALAVGFALRRLWPFAVWVGAVYHTTNTLTMNRTFGVFWFSAIASYLAFVAWPSDRATVRSGADNSWGRLLRRLDLEGAFEWQRAEGRGLELMTARGTYRSWSACGHILLRNPVTYFVLALIAAAPRVEPRLRACVIMVVLLAVALGALVEAWRSRTGRGSARAPSALEATPAHAVPPSVDP
jgi:hypothetical protein